MVDGVRTSADGRELLIAIIGGRPWADGDACSASYRAEAAESDEEVVLGFFQASPAAPADGPNACSSAGYHHLLTVPLEQPLGDRRTVALGQPRFVFDGGELADIPALPEGWTVRYETTGFQPYGSSTPREQFWQRHVGPPPRETCESPPSESGITITEGPAELEDRRATARNGGEYEVRDAVATFWDGGVQVWLEWIEGGRGYSLSASASCDDQSHSSLERLLEVARTLVPPPPAN